MDIPKNVRPTVLAGIAVGLLAPVNNGDATLASGGELLVHPQSQLSCSELLAGEHSYQLGESCEAFADRMKATVECAISGEFVTTFIAYYPGRTHDQALALCEGCEEDVEAEDMADCIDERDDLRRLDTSAYSTVWGAARDIARIQNDGREPDPLVVTEIANGMLAKNSSVLSDVLWRMKREDADFTQLGDTISSYGYAVPPGDLSDVSSFSTCLELNEDGFCPQDGRDIFLAQVAATHLEGEEIASITDRYISRVIGS